MAHIVQCRVCKAKFDTEKLSVLDWVKPVQNTYYHAKCYEDWKESKDNPRAEGKSEDFYYEAMVDYLYKDMKMEVNFSKLKSQWRNFTAPGKKMTPKGIYFTLKYYYEVLHGDVGKAQGGIGIVKSVYSDAAEYWSNLEQKKAGTLEKIIQQIEERRRRPVVKITPKEKQESKARWNLEDI